MTPSRPSRARIAIFQLPTQWTIGLDIHLRAALARDRKSATIQGPWLFSALEMTGQDCVNL
jgi:hypothetical protein